MKILLLISILLISLTSNSSEVYTFNSQVDEQRFYKLIHEVRCPKCTSGSIASSNAPVSEDLKQKIADLINQGYSDKQIKQYAKDWYAFKNWSFDFFKDLDPEQKINVNTVIGNLYTGEKKFISINAFSELSEP